MALARRTARGTGRLVARALAWAAWGAALLTAGGLSIRLFDAARGWEGGLPIHYYFWTSAIPLAGVVAALAWALRERLAPHRRRLTRAGLIVLLAHLVVTYGSPFVPTHLMDLGAVTRPLAWLLCYAAWCLWGAALVTWVLPAPAAAPVPASPLDGRPGADALTDREREVAELLVSGCTQVQTAETLGISASSVSTYRSRACEKLGLASLEELVPREVGSAAGPRQLDVTSAGALPAMGVALCLGLALRLVEAPSPYQSSAQYALDLLVLLALVAAPWLALLLYARLRDMRLRRRGVTGRLALVLAATAFFGLLVGGRNGVSLFFGHAMVSLNALALPAQAVFVALLAPHLLWPVEREAMGLDVERCVLYLRGRGAGELQARVLTQIALGRATPEICEALHVARGTVNAYRAQGYELLGVHSSRELADLLVRDVGLVPSVGKVRPLTDECETSE